MVNTFPTQLASWVNSKAQLWHHGGMALFTPESLEKLRDRVDLIEVLSAHMELKRAGGSYKGLCPFHDEKSPSFMVRRGDRHYHCFGCGAHGDAIAFLMEHLHMSFTEAVESLAQRFGIPIERKNAEAGKRQENKKRLRDCLGTAARLYHYLLLHAEEAVPALEYLYARGLDLEFVRRFQLGFAPDGRVIRALMERQGYDKTVLREVGLIGARGSDFFVNRILFPIRDAAGHVVGFSGRKVVENTFGGKYINTPETSLFHKSQLLYGMSESRRRIAKERRALLVEGQIDCLRLIHAGLDLVVAPLGTAFAEGHLQALVALGVRQVTIAFDADQAGRDAAAKAGDLLQREGIGVTIATLPQGSDPDTVLLENGPEEMIRLIDEARDYVCFRVDHLAQEIDATTPAGKGELVRKLTQQINSWRDEVVVHESLRCLARLLDVPEEMVGVGQRPISQVRVQQTGHTSRGDVAAHEVLETDVLRWLLVVGEEQPQVVELADQHLTAVDFATPLCGALYTAYLDLWRQDQPRDLMAVAIAVGDEAAQDVLSTILKRRVNRERVSELFPKAVLRLLERNWMAKREEIRRRIQSGDLSDDEVMTLAREFDALKQQRPEVTWNT